MSTRDASPPMLALRLLIFTTPRPYREALLGDLAQEFAVLSERSRSAAKIWYWRQALLSLLPLLGWQLRGGAVRTVLLVIATTLIGWVSVSLWDNYVARQSVATLAATENAPSLAVIRSIYFFLFAGGFSLLGAATAQWVFRRDWSFRFNVLVFLGPLSVAVLVVGVAMALSTQLIGYVMFRSVLSLIALIVGAYWAAQRSRAAR